jgi:hypothetical protein
VTISFHPKRLLVTAVFIVAFGSVLAAAADVKRGVAVGALAVLAYVFIEAFIAFNPAWWQGRKRQP